MRKEEPVKYIDNTIMKNFILVVEIASKNAKVIIEGPNEHALKTAELDKVDLATEQKANKLFQEYPPSTYEVILTRALDVNDLQKVFPEFTGWSKIKINNLSYS